MVSLRAALLALLLASTGVARAACEQPAHAMDLQRALNEAQAAYAALDLRAFNEARAEAVTRLSCLGEPISPPLAAAAHRSEAISAFVDDDVQRARSAFRSALVLQPAYRMPEDVLPPGSPLHTLYEEARALGPGMQEPAGLPAGLTLMVDGATATMVPAERPTILQVIAPDGQVQATWYLRVGEPFPDELKNPPPPPVPRAATPTQSPVASVSTPPDARPDRRWVPLAIGAGVSGLVAGATYALSAQSHERYVTPGVVPYEELELLRKTNHGQVLVAGGLGVAALGLGLGAVVVGVW